MTHSKTKSLFWFMSALSVVVIVVGVFIFSLNREYKSKIFSISEEIAKESSKERNLETLKREYDDLVENKKKINNYFIGPDGVVSFIEFVEDIGKKAGVNVRINSAEIEEPKKKEVKFETLNLRAEAIGSFTSVSKFVRMIEYAPYSLVLNRIDLSIEDDIKNTWRGVVEFSVDKIAN